MTLNAVDHWTTSVCEL